MDPMEEIRATFFIECDELLEALEADLLLWEEGENDDETINSIFRAIHSIKGGAGAFALEDLVRFAHSYETTLDEVRSGRIEGTPDSIRLFLRAKDVLADLVRAARDGTDFDTTVSEQIITDLNALTGKDESDAGDDDGFDDGGFEPVALDFGLPLDDDEGSANTTYRIDFFPFPALYANGNEAVRLLAELNGLGTADIEVDTGSVPALNDIDPDGAYFSWTIHLTTEAEEDAIREVFDFAEGDCRLEIQRVENDAVGMDETSVDVAGMDMPADAPTTEEAPSIPPAVIEAIAEVAEQPAKEKTAQAAAPKPVVRVDLERVDRLINLVGELVINQAMLSQCVAEAGIASNSSVGNGLEEFKQLTREIQDSVMAIRAQPVKSLFQRMSRIVREAGDATGKSVRLRLEGEGTEVDKTVIERLSDPLTHMIRNAVDHGLETPEEREAAGKPAEGVVTLSASHRSGRIVIEVADDGKGINREVVLRKAIEKGLVPADAALSNSEIDNLLFMPGFSTAASLSDLSGRGVGMDVVKRSIHSLGGRIAITSDPGKGTSFTVSLPLTLAVLDGMLIMVGDQTLVVPLGVIVETLKPGSNDIRDVLDGSYVMFVRDRYVPVIDVAAVLGFAEPTKDFEDKVALLIEDDEGNAAALLVDGIKDQRQVVIKGLEDNYGHVDNIAAATILGDGQIALIIDPDSLLSHAASGAVVETNQLAGGDADVFQ